MFLISSQIVWIIVFSKMLELFAFLNGGDAFQQIFTSQINHLLFCELNLSKPSCFFAALQHESSSGCCPLKHAFWQSSWLSNSSAMINDCNLFYWMCLSCFILLHQQLEAELHNSWQQLSSMQSHCSDLEDQLSSKEKEAAAKDAQLSQLRYSENITL